MGRLHVVNLPEWGTTLQIGYFLQGNVWSGMLCAGVFPAGYWVIAPITNRRASLDFNPDAVRAGGIRGNLGGIVHGLTHIEAGAQSAYATFESQTFFPDPPQSPSFKIARAAIPSAMSGGDALAVNLEVINTGAAGEGELLLNEKSLFRGTLAAGATTKVEQKFSMPYNDLPVKVTVRSLLRPNAEFQFDYSTTGVTPFGDVWLTTDTLERTVKPLFARAVIGKLELPAKLKSGEKLTVQVSLVNEGDRGEIALQAEGLNGIKSTDFKRVDGGTSLVYDFSMEMPGKEVLTLAFTPQALGRGKQVVNGTSQTPRVEAWDTILIEEDRVLFLGGETPAMVVGLIAAETVDLQGMPTLASTFPPVQGLPYILKISPDRRIEIKLKGLEYFSYKADKPLAIAIFGSVNAKSAEQWEYSRRPSPLGPLFFGLRLLNRTQVSPTEIRLRTYS